MLVGATFLMGSSFVAGKILLNAGVPPLLLVGWRFFVAAIATLPVVLLIEKAPLRALFPAGFSLGNWALVALVGLLQTAAVMGLLFMAMEHVSASTAAILLFTNPIFVALLGRLFLGETLRGPRVVGLVLGLAGAALAIGVSGDGGGDEAVIGALIGLGSALSWATSTIVNKRAAIPMKAWPFSFWQILIGSLALLAVAGLTGDAWPAGTTPVQWGWFLWLAIPGSTISFGLWFMALARGGATRSSGYLFLAPLFATLISHVVLDAGLTWAQGLGGVLVCAGLWLVNREIPAKDEGARLREAISEGQP
jgi:drug/metabolite transporter (DMT)-like permease